MDGRNLPTLSWDMVNVSENSGEAAVWPASPLITLQRVNKNLDATAVVQMNAGLTTERSLDQILSNSDCLNHQLLLNKLNGKWLSIQFNLSYDDLENPSPHILSLTRTGQIF